MFLLAVAEVCCVLMPVFEDVPRQHTVIRVWEDMILPSGAGNHRSSSSASH